MVVWAIGRPCSPIIATRSRKLNLKLKYHRTHRITISWSKCRPLKSSSIGTNCDICLFSPTNSRLHQSHRGLDGRRLHDLQQLCRDGSVDGYAVEGHTACFFVVQVSSGTSITNYRATQTLVGHPQHAGATATS